MGSHSVTCHPTEVNAPSLTLARQAGTGFTIFHRNNFVKILQGSVVTQTVSDGLTIYLPVANFPQKL